MTLLLIVSGVTVLPSLHDIIAHCFRCNCAPQFTGRNCESPYIPCSPSPCENGGSCIVMGSLAYQCKCVEGEYHLGSKVPVLIHAVF